MHLIEYPSLLLSERMPEFNFNDSKLDPVQLEKDLLETMYQHGGIGLAANQVGITARVFVMGHRDQPETSMAFFNPMVIDVTDKTDILEEGCLSFPGIFVKVKRPTGIKARWQNSQGVITEGVLEGYDCKCFLHELDHLEGITFKDRVSSLRWGMSIKKAKRK